MIWVSRAKNGEIEKLNEQLCAEYEKTDIVFVLRAGQDIYGGALILDEEKLTARLGKLKIPEKFDPSYKDLLIRTILNSVRDIKNLLITAGSDDYYITLGFKKNKDGNYEAKADEIVFDYNCKRSL